MARVLEDRELGTEMGVDPAVKAVAQTEMERGERGVALLVLVHVPPGGGRCQADEETEAKAYSAPLGHVLRGYGRACGFNGQALAADRRTRHSAPGKHRR